eukprot:6238749-Prymnesium_polylepis.2
MAIPCGAPSPTGYRRTAYCSGEYETAVFLFTASARVLSERQVRLRELARRVGWSRSRPRLALECPAPGGAVGGRVSASARPRRFLTARRAARRRVVRTVPRPGDPPIYLQSDRPTLMAQVDRDRRAPFPGRVSSTRRRVPLAVPSVLYVR